MEQFQRKSRKKGENAGNLKSWKMKNFKETLRKRWKNFSVIVTKTFTNLVKLQTNFTKILKIPYNFLKGKFVKEKIWNYFRNILEKLQETLQYVYIILGKMIKLEQNIVGALKGSLALKKTFF